MQNDAMWAAFTETGNPIFYMLYRAERTILEEKTGSGHAP